MPANRPQQCVTDERLRTALELLLRAYRYAADTGRNIWEFAVEISELFDAGLARSDLRWLVCKGYTDHGRERTVPGQSGRDIERTGGLVFSRRTCFILTPDGAQFAARLLGMPGNGRRQDVASDRVFMALEAGGATPQPQPSWDRDRHRLLVGADLVKEYKVPSPNQETILTAFEEDGWPPRIDDPLPMAPSIEPKRRLQDTIKSLNRNQRQRLLRFMGDGTGEGVRWEFVAALNLSNTLDARPAV